ncbi:discoidin domain-containing protein [Pleomorphovibrio marinus]|uniref:discoidin domain-containing protein n=1 Tax=Pleomorphovibrio marinus TaxID=2164132 RepID=UPI000E0AF1FF|nr:discoidin domain-containing protein [Pleomorphovibrio marinus]
MKNYKYTLSCITFSLLLFCSSSLIAQQNLSFSGTATASSARSANPAANALDNEGKTSWKSDEGDEQAWLMVRLPGATEVKSLALKPGAENQSLHAQFQYLLNGEWRKIMDLELAGEEILELDLEKPLLTDRIRLQSMDGKVLDLAILNLIGQSYEDASVGEVKKVLVNQSGYNLHRPKGFTAPGVGDKTSFTIHPSGQPEELVYEGEIMGEKGYFHDFNPNSKEEFVLSVGEEQSFPFRIGPYWLERISYRPMLDFMMGARHYVGNIKEKRPLSYAWRDGDFFNWAMQSLVAMYFSNPKAYERMEVTGVYVSNADFPEETKGKWGKLDPFPEHTPDIVQLMHWDADVKVSQQLDHEMQKAELAHFLYAWPNLSEWLPRQNFDQVYKFAREVWEKSSVSDHATSQYDTSPEHNLLALKTQLGTTKGEMPPGFSIIPNLMMYEVGKREGDTWAEKYFDAAYRQMEWIITNLDWQDPMTTKGQRMSEHITMRAFAYFYHQFPDRHPEGLKEKVENWASLMVARSDNLWDFRKYDEDEWTPPGWNETGNILGFPAAVFSALSIVSKDDPNRDRLETIAWAHFENAFGRNPTGRQFSYKGPEEVEGVDLGWYSRHRGGIGLLDELPFVFDGSPKNFHYPNHPEVGNLGWTEGWVQFNTAYNTSMAYLANYYTSLRMEQHGNQLRISIEVPLNFEYRDEDSLELNLVHENGDLLPVRLHQKDPFSLGYEAVLEIDNNTLRSNGQHLKWQKGEEISLGYGFGFMQKTANIKRE